jgi:hypothetical protein
LELFARQTIDWFTQAARDYVHGTASEEREQRAIQVAGQAQLLLRRDFTDGRIGGFGKKLNWAVVMGGVCRHKRLVYRWLRFV